MLLPCPHFSISIVQRSKGQSVVSAAAYQSGERLFCDYDHKPKYYNSKKEVVFSTVLPPACAPSSLANRSALWNSVEKTEKRYDAQLARRIVMALPKEISHDAQCRLIQEYCLTQFVSKGMFADIAVHDKGEGNPHAHILLTLRPVDENGNWLSKCRMVYDLDEQGQKQKNARGNWKCHKEPTVDWNDRKYAEIWRHEWEKIVNRYYEQEQCNEWIDLRSYERQQSEQVPTVHMGPSATQMERRGIRTDVGNLNRRIWEYNSTRRQLSTSIKRISDRLDELNRQRKETAISIFPYDFGRSLINLLWDYYDIRADERKSWSRYAQRKASVNDLQAMADNFDWLVQNGLTEIEDFNARFRQLKTETEAVTKSIDEMESRQRGLETQLKHLRNRDKYRPIYEKYTGKVFRITKERYKEEHRDELDLYRCAVRYFKAHPEMATASNADVAAEIREAKADLSTEKEKLVTLKTQIEPFNRISYYLSQIFQPNPNLEAQVKQPNDPAIDRERNLATISKQQSIEQPQSAKARKRHRSEPSL